MSRANERSFLSLSEYLDALSFDPQLGIIPLQLVADHLGVTRSSVEQMIRNEQLRAIKIGKTRFVQVGSLQEREAIYEHQVSVVREYLEDCVRRGERSVFYQPVMDCIGLSSGVPAHRTKIGKILGDISHLTYRDHKLLLSVLVHRKTAGHTKPGPGFFELANHLKYKWSDDNEFVEDETNKIFAKYA